VHPSLDTAKLRVTERSVWGELTAANNTNFQGVNTLRLAGGWVKAMLYVNAYQSPYTIVRCFNSTLAGAAATTPPCGITFNEVQVGMWAFTFNFKRMIAFGRELWPNTQTRR